MERRELLSKVKLHWHSYIARGGFETPMTTVGRLEAGGIEHWANFLKHGREYVKRFGVNDINFINPPLIKMLTGA